MKNFVKALEFDCNDFQCPRDKFGDEKTDSRLKVGIYIYGPTDQEIEALQTLRLQYGSKYDGQYGSKCARGVMVIVVGNRHGDASSNPWRDWLHFT